MAYVLSGSFLSFLQDTVKTAHESFPRDLGFFLKVWTHDIRGISPSLSVLLCSIASVLEAACWKASSVFADY